MLTKKVWAVIPARYASSRLPGKPLADLGGKPLIQRVYENACSFGIFAKVVVATDDQRIFDCVKNFGGQVVMTSSRHQTGSDRIWEVVSGSDCDIVFNIQGDEPFLPKKAVQAVLDLFAEPLVDVGSAMCPLAQKSEIDDPNCVKVVCDAKNFALYFSRLPIPYNRDNSRVEYFGHIGLYAYKKQALAEFVAMPKSCLEIAENLEQLRFLQAGKKLRMAKIQEKVVGIDTPEDLAKARKILEK